MDQIVEALSGKDADLVEQQRSWVRNHYEETARDQYETVEGKLRLLATILRSNWIERSETWKLQSLGITFGDALVQRMGLEWVVVEDEYGRDPALQDPGTTTIVFPLTTISKRIERGESVDVYTLFEEACRMIEELRPRNRVGDSH
jgi:hypothetical protein